MKSCNRMTHFTYRPQSWSSCSLSFLKMLLLFIIDFLKKNFLLRNNYAFTGNFKDRICVFFTQFPTMLISYITISQSVSSVAQSCLTLRDHVNRSTIGLPVHHQLPEFTQTHVHRVSDVIQPSHPLSSPSPPAPNPSQDQGLFQ